MPKTTFSLALIALLWASACNTTKQPSSADGSGQAETAISFTVAENYFVRNDYRESPLHSIRVTSQQQFDAVFGVARTMGNQPTAIDFSKQDVIACIAESSNTISGLEIVSLKKSKNEILLTYKLTEGEKRSSTSRYAALAIIDKTHQGEVKLQKQ